MTHDPADAMLRRVIRAAEEALGVGDSARRAEIIAETLQPYAGWALRWAVEDCRARGMAWTAIAQLLGRPYSTVLRQMSSGGPIYAHQPAHKADTRNYDGQTPLRRAATELAHRMTALAITRPGCRLDLHLRARVDQLSDAQLATDSPEPLLEATRVVLAAFSQVRDEQREPYGTEETAAWTILEELELCYRRDRAEIQAAHRVLKAAGMLPG
jgi:hypothetical protein